MLVFRIVCAILMAWAVNWALSRPEGEPLLANLPEMRTLGPIAAATIGYFNLAVRQGWGFIVAFANGIWAGVLSIVLSGIFFILFEIIRLMQTDVIKSFENFMVYFGEIVGPLFDEISQIGLIIVSLGATAIVGVVTEIIHWLLVRVKSKKGQNNGSGTANPRA